MFIQGDLQAVFDALFSIGVIDPVLKMDWSKITEQAVQQQGKVDSAISALNSCDGDRKALVQKLNNLDPQVVNFIAVEVAREFAEFTSRSQTH